jgi:hypothetical protein
MATNPAGFCHGISYQVSSKKGLGDLFIWLYFKSENGIIRQRMIPIIKQGDEEK